MGQFVTLATAVVLLATALVPLYLLLRKTRADAALAAVKADAAAKKAAKAAVAAAEVHKIVNQQRTDMQRYQAVLVAALRAAGLEVPVDVSLKEKP